MNLQPKQTSAVLVALRLLQHSLESDPDGVVNSFEDIATVDQLLDVDIDELCEEINCTKSLKTYLLFVYTEYPHGGMQDVAGQSDELNELISIATNTMSPDYSTMQIWSVTDSKLKLEWTNNE